MPWQKYVGDVALELDVFGNPVYREVIVSIPRQCGKTLFLLFLIIHRLLFWGTGIRQNVSYGAQSIVDALAVWESELWPVLQDSGIAGKFGLRFLRGPASSGIRTETYGRVRLETSSVKAGHGQTLALAILDEAMSYTDERKEQALLPTIRTRRDAQLWVVSTAGTDQSVYLKRKVDEGRKRVEAGVTKGSAFFEWGLDVEADWSDESLWPDAVPALGITVDLDMLRHERDVMEESEFRRAALNQWQLTGGGDGHVLFQPEVWDAIVGDNDPGTDVPLWAGVACSQDRTRGAVVVCGSGVLEVVRASEGVDWIPEAVRGLAGAFPGDLQGVWFDGSGPLSDMGDGLRVEGLPVRLMSAGDVRDACGRFYGDVLSGAVSVRSSPCPRPFPPYD